MYFLILAQYFSLMPNDNKMARELAEESTGEMEIL